LFSLSNTLNSPTALPFFVLFFVPFHQRLEVRDIAEPSILRLPVKASRASGHGFDEPISSILFKRSPTALLP